jgi:hypothetical protein
MTMMKVRLLSKKYPSRKSQLPSRSRDLRPRNLKSENNKMILEVNLKESLINLRDIQEVEVVTEEAEVVKVESIEEEAEVAKVENTEEEENIEEEEE